MSPLPVVRSVDDLRRRVADWRAAGATVGLVPTMGALHEGHLSLVRLARKRGAKVVASLFVNPAQFGPNEDFEAYPRDETRDGGLLAAAGCALLYAPAPSGMYPPGFGTTVTVTGHANAMEGAIRPTHFAGVATVVAKLLIQCAPAFAVFGEKDFQQLQVIRRLVRDLDLPVEILAGPIIRDADGLALSSRNAYLTAAQRAVAPSLHRALCAAAKELAAGAPATDVETGAARAMAATGFDAVDYVETRDPQSLERLGPGPVAGPARLLAAARLGKTRLLDNVAI